MFGIFLNKKNSKHIENRKNLIYYESNEKGVISIYFNEVKAKKTRGEYIHDFKGFTKKNPQPSDSKISSFSIYEWAINDRDFINKGDTLLIFRKNENDFIKEVQNEVLMLPDIEAPENGIVEILKKENEKILNNEILCKIHSTDIIDNSNHPDNKIYIGKFNKYEIPKHIRNLNSITGKFIFLKKWLVDNGDIVKEGDDILQVAGGLGEQIYYTYNLKSKSNGIIEHLKLANEGDYLIVSDNIRQNDVLYKIFKNEDIRYNHKYFNVPKLINDEFNGTKIIKWEVVGGYNFPFNSAINNPVGAIISQSKNNKYFIFSFQNHKGLDLLTINFFIDEYKLSIGDNIYFMFENQDLIKFEIVEKPYKSLNNWKKLYETKTVIARDELEKFRNLNLKQWKIELISQNEQIFGDQGNDWYNGENFHKVIRNMTSDYINLVHKEIEDYRPLGRDSFVSNSNINEFCRCFVYLMIDTTNGFYKIGISNTPEYRERTLQSEKPTIELICAKEFPIRKIAETIEKALHETYSDKRIRGEWFELIDSDVKEIKETLK